MNPNLPTGIGRVLLLFAVGSIVGSGFAATKAAAEKRKAFGIRNSARRIVEDDPDTAPKAEATITTWSGLSLEPYVWFERDMNLRWSYRFNASVGVSVPELQFDDPDVYGTASAGLTYRFDVLKYVPYAHVALGAAVANDLEHKVAPIGEAELGVMFLSSRDRSMSIELFYRQDVFANVIHAGLGVSWNWHSDYF